jgi:iron(III) transport system permease protein
MGPASAAAKTLTFHFMPRWRTFRLSPLIPVAVAPMLVLAAFVVVVFWISFQTGVVGAPEAVYGLENYRLLFADPVVYSALRNTLVFAVATTLVAMAIGLPIAWFTERTTIKRKTLIYVIMTVGLLVPGIFVAMGWTFIAHPRIGLVNYWVMEWLGFERPLVNIGTPLGMAFVQGMSLAPLAFILTVQMLRSMNPALEESARTAGLSFSRTLLRVTLPLALPGILAAAIFVFIIGIATFDIPAVLGLANRVYMLSTYIYVMAFPVDMVPRYGIMAALGAAMMVVALGLTFVYGQVLRRGERYQVITGKGYRPKAVDLGRWAIVAWAFIALYAILSKLLPIALVVFMAFMPYVTAPSLEMLGQATLANFGRVNWDLVLRGLQNTLTLMIVVPLLVVVLSFCISWLVIRSRSRTRYALEFGAFLPHTLPDILFALGALMLALFVLRDWIPIYGTVWLIALVYVIVRLAFATRAMNGSVLQIHKELEEAAYVSGLGALRTARRVRLPLMRPTVLAVWLWTTLLVYREVTAAAFLSGRDSITLPAIVWGYWRHAGLTEASVLTLLPQDSWHVYP